jgi:hypothetical protein
MPAKARRQFVQAHQQGQIGGVEVRVPGRWAEHLRTEAQVTPDQCRRFDIKLVVELLHGQRQAGKHAVLDRRQVGVAQLPPHAGRHIAAEHAVVQHRNAGAAHHDVQAVALHEARQRAPQHHDHAAVAVIGVHTAAPQLDHARSQRAQAGQIELGVAVGAAHPFGLGRRQHAVGADDRAVSTFAHQQVLAEIVKEIDVVARHGHGQARAHLARKHLEAQPLGQPHLVLVPGPGHRQAAARFGRFGKARFDRAKGRRLRRHQQPGHRRGKGFVHGRSPGYVRGTATQAWCEARVTP